MNNDMKMTLAAIKAMHSICHLQVPSSLDMKTMKWIGKSLVDHGGKPTFLFEMT